MGSGIGQDICVANGRQNRPVAISMKPAVVIRTMPTNDLQATDPAAPAG
jgi:hypothetical protein